MANSISGNIVQRPNRVEAPLTVAENRIEAQRTGARDAYQLAKLLDPTIGSLEEWIASLAASPIQMQVGSGYIQWKLEKDEVWISLLALEDLIGPQGLPADKTEFRSNGSYIQWRLVNDTDVWHDLVALSAITGPEGDHIELEVNGGYIQWKLTTSSAWINLISVADITGADGRELELQKGGGYIQWRLAGDPNWINLVPLTELIGPKGDTGDNIELSVQGAYLAWKPASSGAWTNLIALADITGPKGDTGPQPFYYQGSYDNGADYVVGDAVEYEGSLWYRTQPPNPGYPPGPGSPYWSLLIAKGNTGATGDPAYCIGVFESVAVLLATWPDGPGMDHLNYWAFAMDATDNTILWLYRPDPLNGGIWAREQINLPVVPLSADATLGGASPIDSVAPSQAAVKSYVDTAVGGVTPESIGAQPAGSYATLDEGGKVPSTQLPSYVDDVVEVSDYAHLPGTGEVGKIYVTLDTNKTYRWGGSAYFEISASPGSTDAVPEGSVNKYYTDARASAAAPVQKVNNKTGDVSLSYSDVGAAPSSHNHDDRYYTEGETDTLLAGKSNTGHTHDDRYYTETEADTLLSGKSNVGHTHDDRYYTESETDTFLDFLRLHLTSGIVSGGVLSINADPTKYNISAGVGYVVNYWSNPGTPTVTKVEWSNQTGLSSSYLSSSVSTTVMVNAAGEIVTHTDPPSRNHYSEYVVLGKLLHPNKTTVTGISHYHHSISGSIGNAMDLMHFLGTLASGVVFSPNGANLQLDRSSGTLLRIGGNYTTSKEAPNITTLASQTPASFFYRYRDGSGGFRIDTPAVTSFNPGVYDNGSGTLATVNNNKFVNHRIYVFTSGNAYVVPGQTEYQSLGDAVAAIATEVFVIDPQLADANLRGVITTKKGVTSLLDSDVKITYGGLLGVLGGSAGGAGSTTPGGVSYDIQYNNGGNFGGATINGLVKAQGSSSAPTAATPGADYALPTAIDDRPASPSFGDTFIRPDGIEVTYYPPGIWVELGPSRIGATGGTGAASTVPGPAGPSGIRQTYWTRYETDATSTAVIPFDNSPPQSNEGTALTSFSFTPTSADSWIEIDVVLPVSAGSAGIVIASVYQDSDVAPLTTGAVNLAAANTLGQIRLFHRAMAGNTTSRTYAIRFGGYGPSSTYVNRSSSTADLFSSAIATTILIREYAP